MPIGNTIIVQINNSPHFIISIDEHMCVFYLFLCLSLNFKTESKTKLIVTFFGQMLHFRWQMLRFLVMEITLLTAGQFFNRTSRYPCFAWTNAPNFKHTKLYLSFSEIFFAVARASTCIFAAEKHHLVNNNLITVLLYTQCFLCSPRYYSHHRLSVVTSAVCMPVKTPLLPYHHHQCTDYWCHYQKNLVPGRFNGGHIIPDTRENMWHFNFYIKTIPQ